MFIIAPIKTEKAVIEMEFNNIIQFQVTETTTKTDVKTEVEKLFGVKVKSVKINNTPRKGKCAIVKLTKDSKMDSISEKLKLI